MRERVCSWLLVVALAPCGSCRPAAVSLNAAALRLAAGRPHRLRARHAQADGAVHRPDRHSLSRNPLQLGAHFADGGGSATAAPARHRRVPLLALGRAVDDRAGAARLRQRRSRPGQGGRSRSSAPITRPRRSIPWPPSGARAQASTSTTRASHASGYATAWPGSAMTPRLVLSWSPSAAAVPRRPRSPSRRRLLPRRHHRQRRLQRSPAPPPPRARYGRATRGRGDPGRVSRPDRRRQLAGGSRRDARPRQKAGFKGVIVKDGGYFKVRLGEYATRAEASAAAAKVKATLGGAPFVVAP